MKVFSESSPQKASCPRKTINRTCWRNMHVQGHFSKYGDTSDGFSPLQAHWWQRQRSEQAQINQRLKQIFKDRLETWVNQTAGIFRFLWQLYWHVVPVPIYFGWTRQIYQGRTTQDRTQFDGSPNNSLRPLPSWTHDPGIWKAVSIKWSPWLTYNSCKQNELHQINFSRKHLTPHFFVDFRKFNAVKVKDSYPNPCKEGCIDSLGDTTVFSTLRKNYGYWNVGIADASHVKTAFTSFHIPYNFFCVLLPSKLHLVPFSELWKYFYAKINHSWPTLCLVTLSYFCEQLTKIWNTYVKSKC